jgi:hypothetical protein
VLSAPLSSVLAGCRRSRHFAVRRVPAEMIASADGRGRLI